jgi:hypothetical protein
MGGMAPGTAEGCPEKRNAMIFRARISNNEGNSSS